MKLDMHETTQNEYVCVENRNEASNVLVLVMHRYAIS